MKPAPAQRVAALPRVATGAFAGATGVTPTGSVPVTFQFWYHGQNLPLGSVLQRISVRADARRPCPGYTLTQSIRMANVATPLGSNLALNRGPGSVLVLPPSTITCQPNPGGGSPDVGACWTPLQTPFAFTGPHLLIEIEFTATSAPSGNPVTDYFQMISVPAFHTTSGAACGGALSVGYGAGSYSVTATALPPGAPTLFLLGFDNMSSALGPLPLDLTPFGLVGCELGVDPFATVITSAQASGTATWTVPFASAGGPATVFAQAFFASGTHPGRWASTEVGHSALGPSGLCDMLVSSNGVTADPGFPRGYNSAPVFLWQ